MQQLAKDLHLVVILKGAYTRIALPNGNIYFNSTGNAGMATGGTGDVLSGMLAGLLAQNLSPEKAALLGVYLHGLAGDLALRNQSMESLIAGDVIDNIGNAFRFLREQ
jgi:NAD(P)H-hydrate epimerase